MSGGRAKLAPPSQVGLNDERRVSFFYFSPTILYGTPKEILTFSTMMFSPKEFEGFPLKNGIF